MQSASLKLWNKKNLFKGNHRLKSVGVGVYIGHVGHTQNRKNGAGLPCTENVLSDTLFCWSRPQRVET